MKKYIIFALTTLIPLTMGKHHPNDVMAIELELPSFLQGLMRNIVGDKRMRSSSLFWNLRESNEYDDEDNFFIRITPKGLQSGPEGRRGHQQPMPGVELGPGAFKTEIVKYPQDYVANKLKHLLKIKEKQQSA